MEHLQGSGLSFKLLLRRVMDVQFTRIFEAKSRTDVVRHVKQAPFAWLFSASGAELEATPLPLLADTDDTTEIVSLMG